MSSSVFRELVKEKNMKNYRLSITLLPRRINFPLLELICLREIFLRLYTVNCANVHVMVYDLCVNMLKPTLLLNKHFYATVYEIIIWNTFLICLCLAINHEILMS